MKSHDILDREHAPSSPSLEQWQKIGNTALTHPKVLPEQKSSGHVTPHESGETTVVPLEGWGLIHPPENANDPTYVLADSLAHLRNPRLPSDEKEKIREIVQHDAEALASQLLPPEKVYELDLPPHDSLDENLQHEVHTPDNETPPMLREVMLLIRAFDETGDPKIKGAVKLIFEEMPPAASNELQEAYQRAMTNGTRIMRELGDIAIEKINVPTPLEKATQEFFKVTRTAHRKMLEDEKLPFSDIEPDATIPPGIER